MDVKSYPKYTLQCVCREFLTWLLGDFSKACTPSAQSSATLLGNIQNLLFSFFSSLWTQDCIQPGCPQFTM